MYDFLKFPTNKKIGEQFIFISPQHDNFSMMHFAFVVSDLNSKYPSIILPKPQTVEDLFLESQSAIFARKLPVSCMLIFSQLISSQNLVPNQSEWCLKANSGTI